MKYLVLISVLALSGFGAAPVVYIEDTMRIIALSEQKAPRGVAGTFRFLIKASGSQNGHVYLNTELDYRDRRSITVVLTPEVISGFAERYNSEPITYFIDKVVEIKGEAKRQKISIFFQGIKTSKYYFQTHIKITSLDQIKILG